MVKKKGCVTLKLSNKYYNNKISTQLKTINFLGKYNYCDALIFLSQYSTQQIVKITHLIFHMATHQTISISFFTPKSKFITMHCLI